MRSNSVHILSNKNFEAKTADCAKCGKGIEIRQFSAKRTWKCVLAKRARLRKYWEEEGKYKDKPYRKHFANLDIKKCEKCEIQNEDFRFFDVNHIDGDHDNNQMENLELLCPNCHRIETLKQWAEGRMEKYNRNYKELLRN